MVALSRPNARLLTESLQPFVECSPTHRYAAGPLLMCYLLACLLISGLEQVDDSVSLFEFHFPRRAVLLLGNERLGIEPELLRLVHQCVEIPVYGPPHSYNVVTAATMAIYEYCKQFPQ